ncbi:hypothetical protein KGM_207208 [Danaus plexippus plexippus]|uniref:Uncharacterized protein n=1 Tax=Danaus plexippus plexippus TaxID=278856 RepID=A0A212FDG7_DANPL|nr:hypothetical protein KGM_207208 [Danaus plexippus plexippus]
MAKFIKSIFNTTERRKSRYEDAEEDKNNFTPPLDDRRKLSTSRSGRLKQANKKRHSLSLELYNQEMEMYEKRNSNDSNVANKQNESKISKNIQNSTEIITPEEQIESAFSVIDKT